VHWNNVAILGVGLLGGSLGLALKKRRLAGRVTGFVRRTESLRDCWETGAVDFPTSDLKSAVEGADLVFLCLPVGSMNSIAEQIQPYLKPDALATDVGSVKAEPVADLESIFERSPARFVGSHPMAGNEKTGVRNARADLFDGKVCVVTPTERSCAEAVDRLEETWHGLGARVLRCSPEAHDEYVSVTSHLPQIVASALASEVLDSRSPATQTELCAAGFRDTTRLASSSPEMWRDITLANQRNISRAVDSFIGRLIEFKQRVDSRNAEALLDYFSSARTARQRWLATSLTHPPEC
jgi:prephenate dehydrogenase